jgi:hypothetical protein
MQLSLRPLRMRRPGQRHAVPGNLHCIHHPAQVPRRSQAPDSRLLRERAGPPRIAQYRTNPTENVRRLPLRSRNKGDAIHRNSARLPDHRNAEKRKTSSIPTERLGEEPVQILSTMVMSTMKTHTRTTLTITQNPVMYTIRPPHDERLPANRPL